MNFPAPADVALAVKRTLEKVYGTEFPRTEEAARALGRQIRSDADYASFQLLGLLGQLCQAGESGDNDVLETIGLAIMSAKVAITNDPGLAKALETAVRQGMGKKYTEVTFANADEEATHAQN